MENKHQKPMSDKFALGVKSELDKLIEDIDHQILKRNNDIRYKRSVIDRLEELNLFNSESIADEFSKIVDKKSTLPSSLRSFIDYIFRVAIYNYLKTTEDNKSKEEDNSKKLVNKITTTSSKL